MPYLIYKPPTNKDPPWTIGGTLFWALGGGLLFKQSKKSAFSPSFSKQTGVDFYLDRCWGARSGVLFGHGTNKEGDLYQGVYITAPSPNAPARFFAKLPLGACVREVLAQNMVTT